MQNSEATKPEKRLCARALPARTPTTLAIHAAHSPCVQLATATPQPATVSITLIRTTVNQPSSSLNIAPTSRTLPSVFYRSQGELVQRPGQPFHPAINCLALPSLLLCPPVANIQLIRGGRHSSLPDR